MALTIEEWYRQARMRSKTNKYDTGSLAQRNETHATPADARGNADLSHARVPHDRGMRARGEKLLHARLLHALRPLGRPDTASREFPTQIISPFTVYFNPRLILRKFELWRLFTNFMFFGSLGARSLAASGPTAVVQRACVSTRARAARRRLEGSTRARPQEAAT